MIKRNSKYSTEELIEKRKGGSYAQRLAILNILKERGYYEEEE